MFDGFATAEVDVGETTIFIRRKGSGPPLLLLHGFPQTHLMWHRVAPALAEEFTVVCADLPGYGASGKPPSRPDHAPYAKGAMALDMVRLMQAQGFSRFSVAGHETHLLRRGTNAVSAAADFRPDVILLDIGLPDMDGYEVARELRADGRTKDAFIVAVTGYGRDADRARISFRLPPGVPVTGLPAPAGVHGGAVVIETARPAEELHRLTGWALQRGVTLSGLTVDRPSLEDVYLRLTSSGAQPGAPERNTR